MIWTVNIPSSWFQSYYSAFLAFSEEQSEQLSNLNFVAALSDFSFLKHLNFKNLVGGEGALYKNHLISNLLLKATLRQNVIYESASLK